MARDRKGSVDTGQAVVLGLKLAASLAVAGLALIPFGVLVSILVVSTPTSVPLFNLASVPASRASQDQECHGSVRIYLYLHKLDLTNGSLNMNVSTCVPRNLGPVRHGRRRTPVVLLIPALGSDFSRALPSGTVLHPVGSVTVPINGDPRRYPLDTYSSSFKLSISPVSESAYATLSVGVRADPGVGGFSWLAGQFERSHTMALGGSAISILQPISIQGRRDPTTRLVVLCLLAVPLVLIILMAVLLWSSKPSVEGLFGVTAIMFAILPIRSVLVPGEIGSLTMVDFALASEMAALATGIALVYMWRWGGPEQTRDGVAEADPPARAAAAGAAAERR